MNCVFDGNSVKAFGKAIQALSRIGDALWIDPTVRGLALRSVNAAQSAYACFLFSPMFFQKYSLASQEAGEPIKCKLSMKSLLPLFRCLTSIERNVERCQISVNTASDRVLIQFFCKHGITKTHNLRYQESAALQAVFSSQLCPNVMKAPARLLANMVMHFPASQEEVTLSIAPFRVSLMNYHEDANDHMKMIHTEMALHSDEFDYFQSAGDSAITFCLKELRGLLSFAELHCLPVSIHCGAAGTPACFSVEDLVLEATVVLATLIESDSRGLSQAINTPDPISPRCADAAAVSCEAATPQPLVHHDGMEMVASSQGSPFDLSATHHHSLLRLDETWDTTSPASSMICSLLFRALSAEQGESPAAALCVLAHHSDMEEDEDSGREASV
uniref:cell cycle checkpoint control protein RAD9B n=1 Tax=Doryrhamphus excisus TaxID=161450 RepID=UPI0025ADAB10|nr:cell cycle checkpoint control protein RAD9B [Doryrhamphus excisus]